MFPTVSFMYLRMTLETKLRSLSFKMPGKVYGSSCSDDPGLDHSGAIEWSRARKKLMQPGAQKKTPEPHNVSRHPEP